jgi:branched-chain amino acid transport system ATP-binding protein
MAAIIVEQHAHKVLPITRRAVVLERGRVVLEASSAALLADPAPLERFVGVTQR